MSRFNQSISSKNFASDNDSDSATNDSDSGANDPCNATSQCGAFGLGFDADEMLSAAEGDAGRHTHFSAPRHFFLPMHFEPKYQYPLIVWLHNDGYNENQIEQLMPHISLRNYIAVGVRGNRAADSVGHRFDWHDSSAAIETAHHRVAGAIDDAVSQFSVHPDRVVLAGYRSGGTMALRIAMRDPSRFAAVASFGGRMPNGGNAFGDLNTLRRHRLSMLWQWAEDDACYQPDSLKEDIQSALTINAKVDILQYKGDDEMNTAALSELNQWIMSRVVSGVATASAAADPWSTSPTGFSNN